MNMLYIFDYNWSGVCVGYFSVCFLFKRRNLYYSLLNSITNFTTQRSRTTGISTLQIQF